MYYIGENLFLITQTLGYFRVKSSVPLILDTRFECGIESNNFNCRHNTDVLKQISCIAFFFSRYLVSVSSRSHFVSHVTCTAFTTHGKGQPHHA